MGGVIGPGNAFWLWEPAKGKHHIAFVLTHPEPRPRLGLSVVMVHVTSIYPHIAFDPTTVLESVDYPDKITHRSYVWYGKSAFRSVSELTDLMASIVPETGSPMAIPLPAASSELFEKLCDGLQESDYTPEDIREYCFHRHPGDGRVLDLEGG